MRRNGKCVLHRRAGADFPARSGPGDFCRPTLTPSSPNPDSEDHADLRSDSRSPACLARSRPPTPSTEYFVCLANGKLTKVGTASSTCKATARLISWNSEGPSGSAGPQGPTGSQGAAGPQGPQGPAGATACGGIPHVGIDLSGCDLTGALLEATNFTDADLGGVNLTDADLSDNSQKPAANGAQMAA
ncbi:MAG: pentapeptide repeat-containing protein [Acidimicrobiales bacterium]